jgi:hypothetical protein
VLAPISGDSVCSKHINFGFLYFWISIIFTSYIIQLPSFFRVVSYNHCNLLVSLIQKLCFWTISIVLLTFKTQRFGNWILSPSLGPERGGQLRRFYLKTETESSLRNFVFKYKQNRVLDKNRKMDNAQKHNVCTNVLSSQTFVILWLDT